MEIALANYFNYRANIVVTNISWGMGLHECDLLVLSKAGYLTEIEIKVSKSDLKNDVLKKHEHKNHKIKSLYFAFPDGHPDWVEYVPERAGIIEVYSVNKCRTFRAPIFNFTIPVSQQERENMLRLAYMRTWTLKRKLFKIISKGK